MAWHASSSRSSASSGMESCGAAKTTEGDWGVRPGGGGEARSSKLVGTPVRGQWTCKHKNVLIKILEIITKSTVELNIVQY